MFKLRNVAGVALVLGIAAGVWLSDFWKGFGGGNGIGLGTGGTAVSVSSGENAGGKAELGVDGPASTTHAGQTVRVVIRDRSYYLKDGREETPVTLEQLLEAVRGASGDDDGVKLRVYRAESSRPTAELQLQEALQKAELPESAAYWSPEVTP